jgi:hypothetical protein
MNSTTMRSAVLAGLFGLVAVGSVMAAPQNPLGPTVDMFSGSIGQYDGGDDGYWHIDEPSDGELDSDEGTSGGGSGGADDNEDEGVKPGVTIRQ